MYKYSELFTVYYKGVAIYKKIQNAKKIMIKFFSNLIALTIGGKIILLSREMKLVANGQLIYNYKTYHLSKYKKI